MKTGYQTVERGETAAGLVGRAVKQFPEPGDAMQLGSEVNVYFGKAVEKWGGNDD